MGYCELCINPTKALKKNGNRYCGRHHNISKLYKRHRMKRINQRKRDELVYLEVKDFLKRHPRKVHDIHVPYGMKISFHFDNEDEYSPPTPRLVPI